MQQFEQAPVPADIQQQVTNIANSIGTVPSGETVEGQISSANTAIAKVANLLVLSVANDNNDSSIADACQRFINAMGTTNHAVGDLAYNSFRYVINAYKYSNAWATIDVFGYSGAAYHCWKENGTWVTKQLALKNDIPTVSVGASFNITLNDKGVASVSSANIPTVTGKTRSMVSLANFSSADLSASQIPPTVIQTSGGDVYILGSPSKTYSGLQLRGLFI